MARDAAMDPTKWQPPDLGMDEWTDTWKHQGEWGVGHGGWIANSTYLLLAQFLGGIGAGACLLSLFLARGDADWYFVAGYILAVGGKGLFHLLFLGHPERFWRAVFRWSSSWISRGIIVLSIFSLAGLAYIVWPVFELFPDPELGEKSLAIICAATLTVLVTYDGFILREAAAIAAWNMSLMVILYPAFSLLGGTGLIGFLYWPLHDVERLPPFDIEGLHEIEAIMLAIGAVALGAYLLTLYNTAALRSTGWNVVVKGRLAVLFWPLVVGGGIVLPLIFSAASLTGHWESNVEIAILALVALVAVAADYAFKYTIFSIGGFDQQFAPTTMPALRPTRWSSEPVTRWR